MKITEIDPHIKSNRGVIQDLARFESIELGIKTCYCGGSPILYDSDRFADVSCFCGRSTETYDDDSSAIFNIAKYKAIWDWNNDIFGYDSEDDDEDLD